MAGGRRRGKGRGGGRRPCVRQEQGRIRAGAGEGGVKTGGGSEAMEWVRGGQVEDDG